MITNTHIIGYHNHDNTSMHDDKDPRNTCMTYEREKAITDVYKRKTIKQ